MPRNTDPPARSGMPPPAYSVTFVVPAYNEELNLQTATDRIAEVCELVGLDYEAVIVNDCSKDGTGALAERLSAANPRLRVIHNPVNIGLGSSFLTGARAATKDAVVMIPGDAENDPWQVIRYCWLLEHVDIIVPFVCNNEVRSKLRRVVSSLFRFIVNMSFGTSLNYTNGTVLYKKAVLDAVPIKTTGFFYQTEILIRSIRRGYLYCEAPVVLDERPAGHSHALSVKNLYSVCKAYLTLMWDIHVGRKEHQRPNLRGETLKRDKHHEVRLAHD